VAEDGLRYESRLSFMEVSVLLWAGGKCVWLWVGWLLDCLLLGWVSATSVEITSRSVPTGRAHVLVT
jgi:hypothetical protein